MNPSEVEGYALCNRKLREQRGLEFRANVSVPPNHLEDLSEHGVPGPTAEFPIRGGPDWGLRSCISSQRPGGASAAVQGPRFEEHWLGHCSGVRTEPKTHAGEWDNQRAVSQHRSAWTFVLDDALVCGWEKDITQIFW